MQRERDADIAEDREEDKEGTEGGQGRRVGYPVEWSRNRRCHLTTRRNVANANETQTEAAATLTATQTATEADKARPQKGKTHKAKRNLIARQRRD